MLHVPKYTVVDVEVHNPAVVSHCLHWPDVLKNNKTKRKHVSSRTVYEQMRVNFLCNNKSCLRSSVVMDVSDVAVVEHCLRASKTYVTCLQGDNMLCLQNISEFATSKLKIVSAKVCKDAMFLLGQSTSVAACDFPNVGPVSVLMGLCVTTYKPVTAESTFELFQQMCSQAEIPVEFHLHFAEMGYANVPIAYTSDTSLTDLIRDERLKLLSAQMLPQDMSAGTDNAAGQRSVDMKEPFTTCTHMIQQDCAFADNCDDIESFVPWPPRFSDLSTVELSFFE